MDAHTTHRILTAARQQQAEFNFDDDFGPALTQPTKAVNPFAPRKPLRKLGKFDLQIPKSLEYEHRHLQMMETLIPNTMMVPISRNATSLMTLKSMTKMPVPWKCFKISSHLRQVI